MNNPEHSLQSKCVISFSQKYPEQRGYLIGYFAETESPVQGALKNSLGLVRGVSDLIYFHPNGNTIGIEMKAPGSSHKVGHLKEQASWLTTVPTYGWFCDSEEMFWDIINYNKGGYDPEKVYEVLTKVKSSSISWDKLVSLIK